MDESLSTQCAALVEQKLRFVNDARPAARAWFADHGRDEQALNAAALAVGTAYVEGRISFGAGSSFMNGLMAQSEWEAPKTFWSIYIAFEDFETTENPGSEAVQHVASALASAQESIAQCKSQPGTALR
jgi:hypothetical protein